VASYKLLIKPSAAKEIESTPKKDRLRIVKRIQDLSTDPRPPGACDCLVTGLPVALLERGMKVRVVCYEGYKAEETPRAFLLGERRVEVVRVPDRWRGEDHEYVKLDGSDGACYILMFPYV